MKVAIINNIPSYWGAGKYAFQIHEKLKRYTDFIYLDYDKRRIEVNGKLLANIAAINKLNFLIKAKSNLPDYDIYHFANQNLSFMAKEDKKNIITCHDIYPYLHPKNILEKQIRKYLYGGLKKSFILADSKYTKKDLIEHFGIDPDKIEVIYLASSRKFKPLNKNVARKKLNLPQDKKVILHIGEKNDKRKNTYAVFNTFLKLRKKINNLLLVRVGKGEFKEDGVINYYRIDEDKMPLVYNAADILLFPSHFEGFGLPIIEAMQSGLPVVTSNTTSIPEIAGNAAILVNPDNESEILDATYKVLTDKNLSQRLINKGIMQAKKFSWEKTAAETLKVYKNLIKQIK